MTKHTDVLIVGAGPTGLTAANILAQEGLDCRLIERDPAPIDESRALWVHSRTLELWDKLGILKGALSEGKEADRIDILINGEPKGYIPYRGDGLTPYPHGLVLEQSKTQHMLVNGLVEAGGVVEWSTNFASFEQHPDGGVDCMLERADGTTERLNARYLVGADGFTSKVREALGVGFEGSTYPTAFFVADVEMESELGRDRIYFDMTPEHFFAFLPMYGGDQFRLIGSLTAELKERFGPGRDPGTKGTIDAEAIEDHINLYSGLKVQILRANWASVYRVHRRIADRYRVGSVFLAGDSAHVHGPTGGQGMNTGIADAFNLGWKLAAVIEVIHARNHVAEEPGDPNLSRPVLKTSRFREGAA